LVSEEGQALSGGVGGRRGVSVCAVLARLKGMLQRIEVEKKKVLSRSTRKRTDSLVTVWHCIARGEYR